MTLADLGLLSAWEPIALPPRYQKHVPPIDELPTKFRDLVDETRKRPISAFAERLLGRFA
jgi:hypothetical protein